MSFRSNISRALIHWRESADKKLADALEVQHTDAIPSDYKGLMGVPITFLDKYCPEQFELVRFRKGDDGKDLTLNGKPPYFRILIRAREGR